MEIYEGIRKKWEKEQKMKNIKFTKPGATEVTNATNFKHLPWESEKLKSNCNHAKTDNHSESYRDSDLLKQQQYNIPTL